MAAALDVVNSSTVSPAVRFNVSGTRYAVGKSISHSTSVWALICQMELMCY